jgi:hypothetical protein
VPDAANDLRQQVHRDDARIAEAFLEDVPLYDPDPVGHAFDLRQAAGELRELGVVLDADGPGAERWLGRRDRDPPVTGAQVEHEVLRRDLRDREHGEDHGVEGRHPGHVLAVASPGRGVGGFAIRARARLRVRGCSREEQQRESSHQGSRASKHRSASRALTSR